MSADAQPNEVIVTILRRKYRIKCPADKMSELQESAQYVDKKMRELREGGKMVGIERMAIVAALNISYELTTKKRQEQDHIMGLYDHIHDLQQQLKKTVAMPKDSDI